MKRRLLYKLGRAMEVTGNMVDKWVGMFPRWLASEGQALWDRNCDCERCIERNNRRIL